MNPSLLPVQYQDLLRRLRTPGQHGVRTNARTGVRVAEHIGAAHLSIDLQNRWLPNPGNRAYWPRVAAAETAWQVQGTKDATFIVRHAPKLWSKFTDAEGRVEAAYGWRWRRHFGRDQLCLAIEALAKDETTRQVWVQAWDPSGDGLGQSSLPNIPCPLGFTLNVDFRGRVNMAVMIRSSDVYVGLPYDLMNHAMLLGLVAAELHRPMGMLDVTLANAHLYETHWAMADDDLVRMPALVYQQIPPWRLTEVEMDPEGYVKAFAGYRPDPDVPSRFPEVVL